MNLYLLTRLEKTGWDEYHAKVIVAYNHANARELANLRTGDEGKIWTDETKVACVEVSFNSPSIVWEDFKAG